jgi:NAD kinase
MLDLRPGIAIITRKTRMQGLLARWATRGQAKFRLKAAKVQEQARSRAQVTQEALAAGDEDFDSLEAEDDTYQQALAKLHQAVDFGLPIQVVDREFVPNFDFARFEVVIVIGQDGLVANAAKYVGDVPIVAINPDPKTIDGILLPFQLKDARRVVGRVLDGKFTTRDVTLAEANLPDGQKLLAFNDLFIGAKSHVSARYRLWMETVGRSSAPSHDPETQSSSGIIVSTGAGSTGWLSSVFNMAAGITQFYGGTAGARPQLRWEDRQLLWVVREPFTSKHSTANRVMGLVDEQTQLVVESLMPAGGAIFSDGVEADFLEFNSGAIARVGVSAQRARLVWKA